MTKQITITIRDLTFEKCISNFHGNRSEYIEALILKGWESQDYESSYKIINTQLKDENQKLRLERDKAFQELSKLKKLRLSNG